jgi:hypothetical protein
VRVCACVCVRACVCRRGSTRESTSLRIQRRNETPKGSLKERRLLRIFVLNTCFHVSRLSTTLACLRYVTPLSILNPKKQKNTPLLHPTYQTIAEAASQALPRKLAPYFSQHCRGSYHHIYDRLLFFVHLCSYTPALTCLLLRVFERHSSHFGAVKGDSKQYLVRPLRKSLKPSSFCCVYSMQGIIA